MAEIKRTVEKRKNVSVLVVEDDPLIALDLEDTLSRAGFDVVGVAANVEQGLDCIERDPPAAATLDYQLGRETSDPIASALDALEIPYCYVSGRGDLIGRDERTIIAKPAAPVSVVRAVDDMLRS